MEFLEQLSALAPILLDGATGTELERRGVDTGLPLWSANALLSNAGTQVLEEIHVDYLNAGATILTTNTFRTHRRALAPSGNAHRAGEMTTRAVEVARAAIAKTPGDGPRFVAGSISTLEDCYRPDRVPPDSQCRTEHSERLHHLIESGVDLILIETMNSIREASIAARLAASSGTPVIVSFVCAADGRILSGETLAEAAIQLLPTGVAAIGVNCTAVEHMHKPLAELSTATRGSFPLVAYANIGHADDTIGWVNTNSISPQEYARAAAKWPARIIGGCCGTGPAHIAALRSAASSAEFGT